MYPTPIDYQNSQALPVSMASYMSNLISVKGKTFLSAKSFDLLNPVI